MDYFEQGRKVCIFVLDDEEIIASTIAAILRLQGFEAVAFTLPLAALAACHLQVPDLLISDIVMPVLSGLDLALQIQALHPQCRVLLFSGEWAAADFSESARAEKLGFEMISKPVHPKELLTKIKQILSTVLPVPANGEDRARLRTVENMKETVAALQADIAITTARKRSSRRPAGHHS